MPWICKVASKESFHVKRDDIICKTNTETCIILFLTHSTLTSMQKLHVPGRRGEAQRCV